jgi:hypothetical protein
MARRHGRGRLSSIELLPDDAAPIVAWARRELVLRKRHQIDILAEFNEKLRQLSAEIGVDIQPISLSAFNRTAIGIATEARRFAERREIVGALADQTEPADVDNLTVITAEALKMLVYETLEIAAGVPGAIDTKGTMELARALQAATSAQSVSAERKRKADKEFADRAAKAVDQVAKKKGLSAETVEAIKAKILGVRA